jgi:uncharacterized protein YbbC (DUF1343 family)
MTRLLRLSLAAVALAVAASPALAQPKVRTGVEVLLKDSLHLIAGKRVGLLTNHSGRLPDGTSTVDALFRAPGVKLTALFGPEHGIRGTAKAGEKIATAVDSATGVTVYSLYGDVRAPTPEMLKTVDVLLYDIQDVGARVYTYQWTMALALEAAGKAGVPLIILDRPNPIRADKVDGGMLDTAFSSLVGLHPVALRYGFTPGELGEWLVGSGRVKAEVKVVPMQGYTRAMYYEDTGLPWENPSPNLRNNDANVLYTGTVFFEGVNVSEGRGTNNPFAQVGASWMTDAGAIVKALNAKKIPGVWFDSISRPVEPGYEFGGQTIPMVRVTVTNRDAVVPVNVGAHMLREIYVRHKDKWEWRKGSIDRLSGSTRLREAVEKDGGIEALLPVFKAEADKFLAESKKYWIYK